MTAPTDWGIGRGWLTLTEWDARARARAEERARGGT